MYKKAMQLKISRVMYIDAYPDIGSKDEIKFILESKKYMTKSKVIILPCSGSSKY